MKAITDSAGKPPVGWYTGRFGMHTLTAVIKHGGFLYRAIPTTTTCPTG